MYGSVTKLFLAVSCASLALAGGASQREMGLREQVRLHPESFQANHLAGEYYAHQGNLEAAISYLQKAQRLNPEDYVNSYDLALAYFESGALADARGAIATLLKRRDRAELHNLLGDLEEKEGHIEQAARQYEIAARMDPSEKNLFDLGGDLLLHRGFEPALKVFEFGTARYPPSGRLRVGLGVALYSLGRYGKAIEALCQAVDLDPKDTKALDFLGKMYDVAPEQAENVTSRLARFAKMYPDNPAANYYYALSLRRRTAAPDIKDFSQPEALLLKAVKLNPRFAGAYYALGLLYEDESQPAKAMDAYEHATRAEPHFGKALYRLARLHEANGQRELAQREFRAFEALKTDR